MGWQELLEKENEQICLPWLGSRQLIGPGGRCWDIRSKLPPQHGWHSFHVRSKVAVWLGAAEPAFDVLKESRAVGYLVGNRLIPENASALSGEGESFLRLQSVHLIAEELERFVRVSAAAVHVESPLVFLQREFANGPEDEVRQAFLDRMESVSHIKGVPPALDMAFKLESHRRKETEFRRQELEKREREENERIAREERRAHLLNQMGDAKKRRELALEDFQAAATAALTVSGAEYLDHRRVGREYVVTFRFLHRSFQCVCTNQLQIVDAGVCLTDHQTGVKGDRTLTLESLPGVIREAMQQGVLVVFRHVGDEDD